MDHEQARRDTLHGPWPTPAEELQGLYGDTWNIHRELGSNGHHGDWIAERWDPIDGETNKLIAADIESLADQLAAADA